jgi:hypothetical protein
MQENGTACHARNGRGKRSLMALLRGIEAHFVMR